MQARESEQMREATGGKIVTQVRQLTPLAQGERFGQGGGVVIQPVPQCPAQSAPKRSGRLAVKQFTHQHLTGDVARPEMRREIEPAGGAAARCRTWHPVSTTSPAGSAPRGLIHRLARNGCRTSST